MIGNDVVETLCQLLESWGPNGERWCKGLGGTCGWDYQTDTPIQNFCVLGAIGRLERDGQAVQYPETLEGHVISAKIQKTLHQPKYHRHRLYTTIIDYNDAKTTAFNDVRELICDTIKAELALEEAKLDA